jgi:polyhydroxybutyrate depolymerase
MNRQLLSLLVGLASLAPGLLQAQASTGNRTLVSGGIERSYLLHLPDGYDGQPIPLVLNFHGSGGVPESQLATSRFDALSDEAGFAVAFPAGVFTNPVSVRSWNANVESGVDDVQFARDLIADVAAEINVDTSRIYATGFSGGARMTSRLACELADVLAAAAPVAGLQYPEGCEPARPIPILAIHGKADRVNQYEVSASSPPYWRMGLETAVARWREAIGCEAEGEVSAVEPGVELRYWSDCSGDAEIRFYVIENGGHVWPDMASRVIWSFFESQSL